MKAKVAGKGKMVELGKGTPQIEALFPFYDEGRITDIEITCIGVQNFSGKPVRLDFGRLAGLLGGRRTSIEIGDTFNNAWRLIDLTNPANTDILCVIKRDVVSAFGANPNFVDLNLHEVACAEFVMPGQIPTARRVVNETARKMGIRIDPPEFLFTTICDEIVACLRKAGSDAGLRYENVHPLSTQRGWDDCVKYAPLGNWPRIKSIYPYTLDIDHLMMAFWIWFWMWKMEVAGWLQPVPDCPDHYWVFARNVDKPYAVYFGSQERAIVEKYAKIHDNPTAIITDMMDTLAKENLLAAIHLVNLPMPNFDLKASINEQFRFHDAGGTLEGAIDLKAVAKCAIRHNALIVCELNEPVDKETGYNGYEQDRPMLQNALRMIAEAEKELVTQESAAIPSA